MNTKNQNLVKKATALFSAIAASSFLGLPAFAQVNSNTSQYGSQQNRMAADCVPTNQSSNMNRSSGTYQSNRSYSSSASDTSGMSTSASQGYDNQSGSQGTSNLSQAPTSRSPETGTVRSGDLPYGSRTSENRSSNQTLSTPVAPTGQYNQGGVGGPVDNSSSQGTSNYPNSQGSNYSSNQGSQSSAGYSSTYDSQNNTSYGHALYGNVLGRGGSTTGGFARQTVESANNPDRQPDEFANQVSYRGRDNNYQTQAYGTDRSGDNQIQTSGVTSGGQASNQSETNATNLNQSGSTSQYSQGSTSGQIATCPPGMMPRRSMNNQQYPNQYSPDVRNNPAGSNVPGRALPNTIQPPEGR
jgi:hypothetical protein